MIDAVMYFYKGHRSIGVTSSMPEVDVYIDDMYYASVKSGPVTIPNLSPADHDIRVVKVGYHDFTATVQVLSDKIVGVYSDQTKDAKQAGIRLHSDPVGEVSIWTMTMSESHSSETSGCKSQKYIPESTP